MPYCDGSTFGGDNDVNDPGFPFGPTRYHPGFATSAQAWIVGKQMFPDAKQITVMGPQRGRCRRCAFASVLATIAFGNKHQLTVYNGRRPDRGQPGHAAVGRRARCSVACRWWARQNDWQSQKFYPQSCIDDGRCNAFGQQTGSSAGGSRMTRPSARVLRDGLRQDQPFFAQGDGTQ